jgi:L-alanine-DL-glutamate epimerase-like enolase superfamily enzyme
MRCELIATPESWLLAHPFRISRGVKTQADVIVVELLANGRRGRGECVPYARYGETVASVMAQIQAIAPTVEAGVSRSQLQALMPAGAARNAIDCALWDLAGEEPGLPRRDTLLTAVTVGLDTPEQMALAAKRLSSAPLLKVKVDNSYPERQLRAVHASAPKARLIVDANEGWTIEILRELDGLLVEVGAVLIEQPLPAAADEALAGFTPSVPLCADEACHTASDLPRISGRYQAVNIKLDKTGGLTGALELLNAARARDLLVMVGCMVCTSLAIAPAWYVAGAADFVDLDGPLMLRGDRDGGVSVDSGRLFVPDRRLWGHNAERGEPS